MVGHLLQYHPAFLKLKELVAAGYLGRINYIYSNRLNWEKSGEKKIFSGPLSPTIFMILTLAGMSRGTIQDRGRVLPASADRRRYDHASEFFQRTQVPYIVSGYILSRSRSWWWWVTVNGGFRRHAGMAGQAPDFPHRIEWQTTCQFR